MSYTSDIPQSGESLGGTRARINTNFQQIAVVEAVNHVAFNAAGEGKHKFLQMPEQSAAPTTAGNEAGFYSAQANSVSQLFMRRESDGATLQLTASDVSDVTAQATEGYSCLPGGLLIQYGSIGAEASSSTYTITFPKAFSSAPYSVVMSPFKAGTVSTVDSYVQTVSTTDFTIRRGDGHSWDFFWMAIGIA